MLNHMKMKSRFLTFLITCFLGASLVACGNPPANLAKAKVHTVSSRVELGLLLEKAQGYRGGFVDGSSETNVTSPGDGGAIPKGPERDYVDTNEQVEGVSESDIIKTDGYQVYSLNQFGGSLRVFEVGDDGAITLKKKVVITDIYADSLYLTPNYLIMLGTKYIEYEENTSIWGGGGLSWRLPSSVVAVISRTSLEVVFELVNENNHIYAHRLIGDSLYLIGNHYVHADMDEYRPKMIINGTETKFIDYSNIHYFDDTDIGGMTKIIGVKLHADPTQISVSGEAYLGAGYSYKQIYMTATDLYISDSNFYIDEKAFYQTMTISQHKLLLDKAGSEFVAAGTVEGGMLNQFSMDEYNGYLRVATGNVVGKATEERFSFTTEIINSLYILRVNSAHAGFNVISHISEGIGKPNERIMSVRFNGDKAFIVTFLRTDPLYVIDLSDPENPVITDAIELPGYDTYQHAWGENYLMGLGYDANDNGVITGTKLTAYKVTSGEASELQTFVVSLGEEGDEKTWRWSDLEGNRNHKAIFVSVKDNLFGFPYTEWTYTEPQDGEYGVTKHQSVYYMFKIDMSSETPIAKLIEVTHPLLNEHPVAVRRAIKINNHLYFFSDTHVSVYNTLTNELAAPIEVS